MPLRTRPTNAENATIVNRIAGGFGSLRTVALEEPGERHDREGEHGPADGDEEPRLHDPVALDVLRRDVGGRAGS
jgi:hypothetical protein